MVSRLAKLASLLLLAASAFGQAARYDSVAQVLSGTVTPVLLPGSTLAVYAYPGATTLCSGGGCVAAVTYTDQTGATSCSSATPLTRPGGNTCIAVADTAANFGFWALPGYYQYCITASGAASGCYNVLLGDPASLVANSYAGSDIGAQINNAYAALPSTGGMIRVMAGSYSFSTPIVFGTNGKTALLQCAPGATSLTYTGSSGVAISLNYGGLGFAAPQLQYTGHGIDGCMFFGPGYTSSTIGLEMAGTNGTIGATIQRAKFYGFGTGVDFANSTNGSFLSVFRDDYIGLNGMGVNVAQNNQERNEFDHDCICNNTIAANFAANVGGGDYTFHSVHFDFNTTDIKTLGGTVSLKIDLFNPHLENANTTAPSSSNITGGVISITGGVMQDDAVSGTVAEMWLLNDTGSAEVIATGLLVHSGITVTNVFNLTASGGHNVSAVIGPGVAASTNGGLVTTSGTAAAMVLQNNSLQLQQNGANTLTMAISGGSAGSITAPQLLLSTRTKVTDQGTATLSGGTATISFGSTYGTAPQVFCTDSAASAAACNATSISTSGATLKGTGTDVVQWIAFGN